jgi:two-component system OmpR family sensor kinase
VIWDEWSLTAKLLTIMMTLMLIVMSGTSAWVLENLRSSLIERTDARLVQNSQALAIQAAETVSQTDEDSGDAASTSPTESSLRQLLPASYYVQFYDPDGTPLFSPVAPEADNMPSLPHIDEDTVQAMQGTPFTTDGTTSKWRALALHVKDSPLLVAIAIPFEQDIDTVSERARNTMLGIGMLALALVAGVGYFAITNTFRPLKDIETTASKIAAGDLSQRVTPYPDNTELGRLSAALNTMLGHIEDSFDGRTRSEKRIRQFVSDASHELRTPLVTIRGYAELYRQGAVTDPEQVRQAMDRIEAEAKRMGVLVEDLVVLARLDERRPAEIGPVDVGAIVRDAAADAVAQAPDRDISLIGLDGGDAPDTPTVLGSESRLRQVIVNLAGNAIRHTPDRTAVEFAVGVLQPGSAGPSGTADSGTGVSAQAASEGQRNGSRSGRQPGRGARGSGRGTGRFPRILPGGSGQDQTAAEASVPGGGSSGAFAVGQAGQSGSGTAQMTNSNPFVTGPLELGEDLSGFPYGRVRFEVRDHGEGIAPDQAHRIFERFYRLDASRTRDTGGSGLGLSIVKAIVENHSGAISVHPTPGGGATFRVDLPIPGADSVRRSVTPTSAS